MLHVQVALYRYIDEEWSKTDNEGTLFVYERKCEPNHGFLILNRLSPENWVQPITDGIDSQLKPPFILYKTKDSEIYGIWFYEEEKCQKIGKIITKFIKDSEVKNSSSGGGGGSKMDLSSLLSKANDKKEVNLRATKDSPSSGGEKLLRLLSGGAGGGAGAKNPANGVQKNGLTHNQGESTSSVVEFFAQAQQLPDPTPSVPPGGPHIVRPAVVGPVPGVIPIMHGLPPGMTLLPQQPGAPPVLVPIMRPPQPQLLPVSSAMQPMVGPPEPMPSAPQPHVSPPVKLPFAQICNISLREIFYPYSRTRL